MILLWGSLEDDPIGLAHAALRSAGAEYFFLDHGQLADSGIDCEYTTAGGFRCTVSQGDRAIDPVSFRVHDRTHLEFGAEYPIQPSSVRHTWEAYFFVPESFRLHQATYDKKAIYDDLWSYVRYAVPALPFFRLASLEAGSPLAVVRETLAGGVPAIYSYLLYRHTMLDSDPRP